MSLNFVINAISRIWSTNPSEDPEEGAGTDEGWASALSCFGRAADYGETLREYVPVSLKPLSWCKFSFKTMFSSNSISLTAEQVMQCNMELYLNSRRIGVAGLPPGSEEAALRSFAADIPSLESMLEHTFSILQLSGNSVGLKDPVLLLKFTEFDVFHDQQQVLNELIACCNVLLCFLGPEFDILSLQSLQAARAASPMCLFLLIPQTDFMIAKLQFVSYSLGNCEIVHRINLEARLRHLIGSKELQSNKNSLRNETFLHTLAAEFAGTARLHEIDIVDACLISGDSEKHDSRVASASTMRVSRQHLITSSW